MIDWTKTEQKFGIDITNYKFSSTVVAICDGCGVFRDKKIRSKKNVIEGQMEWRCMKCHLDNPETKAKKSAASKKMWADDDIRNKIINSIDYGKISQSAKNLWQNPEYRDKVLKSIEDNRQNLSEQMKKKWQDPEYRKRLESLYRTDEWRKERSEIALKAWEDDDYRKTVAQYNIDRRIPKEEFLRRAIETHSNRYDYSEVECGSFCTDKIMIICEKHGGFSQTPKSHVGGDGCPLCAGTHLQTQIYEFVDRVFDGIAKYNDRTTIYPNELDILIPGVSLAIEVNGMYWHSYDHMESAEERNKHANKLDKCIDKGINLIQITEYEWKEKREIVESILLNKAGKSRRLYARKCMIKELDTMTYRRFIDVNHLQGYNHSNAVYGLTHGDELVAVMSFNRHKKYEWEVTRFANKLRTTVVGGASRLFRCFVDNINPSQVLSYADRRYSEGGLYKKLGFRLNGTTKPNYCYIKGLIPYTRQQFQKHKLKDKLKLFDNNLTEAENMFNNGYRRLWDAGNLRLIYKMTQ